MISIGRQDFEFIRKAVNSTPIKIYLVAKIFSDTLYEC